MLNKVDPNVDTQKYNDRIQANQSTTKSATCKLKGKVPNQEKTWGSRNEEPETHEGKMEQGDTDTEGRTDWQTKREEETRTHKEQLTDRNRGADRAGKQKKEEVKSETHEDITNPKTQIITTGMIRLVRLNHEGTGVAGLAWHWFATGSALSDYLRLVRLYLKGLKV